jgi:GNAT superfamily N-acetyltransferase
MPASKYSTAIPMTTIREMAITEITRIAEIDRSEHITAQYKSRRGALDLIDVDINAPRWGEPGARPVQEFVDEWSAWVEYDGVLLGAFDADRLVGVAIYDRLFCGEPARLAVLHVTKSHRGKGIGAALTREVVRLARLDAASRLYVSATPTRATVDFYIRQGFEPLATPNERLLALEPEDIHMTMPL